MAGPEKNAQRPAPDPVGGARAGAAEPAPIRLSMINPRAIEDFLVAIHFGKQDLLAACVRLAYRDLQRTVRGIAKHDKGNIPGQVREFIRSAQSAQNQGTFDSWHRAACSDLIVAFRAIGYDR